MGFAAENPDQKEEEKNMVNIYKSCWAIENRTKVTEIDSQIEEYALKTEIIDAHEIWKDFTKTNLNE